MHFYFRKGPRPTFEHHRSIATIAEQRTRRNNVHCISKRSNYSYLPFSLLLPAPPYRRPAWVNGKLHLYYVNQLLSDVSINSIIVSVLAMERGSVTIVRSGDDYPRVKQTRFYASVIDPNRDYFCLSQDRRPREACAESSALV